MRGSDPRIHSDLAQSKPLRQGRRSVFSAWTAGSSPAMTSGETRFKLNGTWSNCRGIRLRRENHSSPEISAAIRGVERRDQTTDKAPNEPNEGRHPSQ